MDEIKTYKDFGLTKKQGLYCEYRVQNYNKRKSYMMAFETDDPELANIEVWKMEKKVGTELNAYMYYLECLHQEEFILSLRQLQEMYADICRDENVSMKDRLKAMELYGKTIGAFTDNVKVDTNQTVVFVNEDDIEP